MPDKAQRTIAIAAPQADLFRLRFAFVSWSGAEREVFTYHLRLSALEERDLQTRFLAWAKAGKVALIEMTPLAPSSSADQVIGLIIHELMHREGFPKGSR
jgi:hypothetical protein